MDFLSLIFTGLGLSADAFGVALGKGTGVMDSRRKKALITAIYFGFFQGFMPVIGYFTAKLFLNLISDYGGYISFAILFFIGIKMIINSFKSPKCSDRICPKQKCTDRICPINTQSSFNFLTMVGLALATSLDALVAGVTFALTDANIILASLIIASITFCLSFLGVILGNILGQKLKSKAELMGGIVLILMGIKILLNSFEVLPF